MEFAIVALVIAFPLSDVSPARAGGVAQNDQMRGRRAPGGAPGSTLSLAATIGP